MVECFRQLWTILVRGNIASAFSYDNDNSLLNFWILHLHSCTVVSGRLSVDRVFWTNQMSTSLKTNNSNWFCEILDDNLSARDHSVLSRGKFHVDFLVPVFACFHLCCPTNGLTGVGFWKYYFGNFTNHKLWHKREQSWTISRDGLVRDEDIALRGTHRPALDCISDLLDAWPGNSLYVNVKIEIRGKHTSTKYTIRD